VPYDASKNAGFKGIKPTAPSTKRPDPREAFSLNKLVDETAAETFPLSPGLDEHRKQILSFQKSLHSFASRLLELIAVALRLPPSTFTSQHPRSRPNFDNFELMHYPPLSSVLSTEETVYRISPHTDWGTITLLFQQSVGGLEVRPPHYTSSELQPDEEWTSAPVYNDMVLINMGDMMEFWTAGRLKSTWHRVVPRQETRDTDRYCFAYFLHPDKHAVLEPIKELEKEGWVPRYAGKGRTAEQHIRARISGTVHGNFTTG
jgi:isopenicillin N synthase-like dioxygenase